MEPQGSQVRKIALTEEQYGKKKSDPAKLQPDQLPNPVRHAARQTAVLAQQSTWHRDRDEQTKTERRGTAYFGTLANKTHGVLAVVNRFINRNAHNPSAGSPPWMSHGPSAIAPEHLSKGRTLDLKPCSNAYFIMLQKTQKKSLKELQPTPHSEEMSSLESNIVQMKKVPTLLFLLWV